MKDIEKLREALENQMGKEKLKELLDLVREERKENYIISY